MYKDKIIRALKDATSSEDIKLDTSTMTDRGDYATSVALVLAKRQKRNPLELAKELVSKLEKNTGLKKYVSKIEVAPPGFINFWVSDEALAGVVNEVVEKGERFGRSDDYRNKEAVVEYSSPNIAKPFGIGHFRSTIIGDTIANLLEATGWKVYRDNHLGDWGTQFGKQIYAIKTWGNIDDIEKSKNPVKELVALYVKFHEEAEKDPSLEDHGRLWFKKLEDGDKEARILWQKCIDWSLKEFGEVYQTLGIKFTENDGVGYGESYFEHMMQSVIDELQEKDLLKEGKDNAKLVFFDNDKYPPLMIVKKDGTTLYATRDLATDKFRLGKYGKDVVIVNEVGAEQSLYFQQLFEIERMLGWVKDGQRVHIKHGFFRFTDRKMSTRKGDVIWLSDVINQAIAKAYSIFSDKNIEINESNEIVRKKNSHVQTDMQEIALPEAVAVGALKWNELKRDPIKDIIFDWDEILSMDGNSGPYLQYTFARAASILAKGVLQKQTVSGSFDDKEKEVIRVLIHYPEIVQSAAINYSPHILANYLFNLAQTFNSFYNSERVLGSEREGERLLLTRAVGQVIKNGLGLLGIEAPEKM